MATLILDRRSLMLGGLAAFAAPAWAAGGGPFTQGVASGDPYGYVSVTVRPDHMETRFQAISDRADANAMVSTEKRFIVENGRPGVIES